MYYQEVSALDGILADQYMLQLLRVKHNVCKWTPTKEHMYYICLLSVSSKWQSWICILYFWMFSHLSCLHVLIH